MAERRGKVLESRVHIELAREVSPRCICILHTNTRVLLWFF